jgi:hypothetical protein
MDSRGCGTCEGESGIMSQAYTPESRRSGAYPFHPVKIAGAALLGLGALLTGLLGNNQVGAPTIAINPPAIESQSVTSPVNLTGQGTPNAAYDLFVNGENKGKVNIANDSSFSQQLELPNGDVTVQLKSTTTPVAESNILNLNVASKPVATENVLPVFTDPQVLANGFLPNAPFTLKGTGQPGQELEIFDGTTSLGRVLVAPDGTWSFNVVPTSPGDHDYSALGASGSSQLLTLNIAEKGESGPACPCKLRFSFTNTKTLDAKVTLVQNTKNLGSKAGTAANWLKMPSGDYSYTVERAGYARYNGKASLPKNRSISVYLNPKK